MIVDENTARRIALDLAGAIAWLQSAKRVVPAEGDKPVLPGFARLYLDFAEQHIARILEQLPPEITAQMLEYFVSVNAPKDPA